jgi:hypothetical protein
MPEPIEYLIVKNLQAALAAISVGAGYFFTLAGTAVRLDPDRDIESMFEPTGPRPFIVLQVKPGPWEYFQAGELKRTLPVTVHWCSIAVPTDDDSRMKTFFRGCADIEKAVVADLTRGGLARDTQIVAAEQDLLIDGSQVWARVDLAIPLRRTYGQPNG